MLREPGFVHMQCLAHVAHVARQCFKGSDVGKNKERIQCESPPWIAVRFNIGFLTWQAF